MCLSSPSFLLTGVGALHLWHLLKEKQRTSHFQSDVGSRSKHNMHSSSPLNRFDATPESKTASVNWLCSAFHNQLYFTVTICLFQKSQFPCEVTRHNLALVFPTAPPPHHRNRPPGAGPVGVVVQQHRRTAGAAGGAAACAAGGAAGDGWRWAVPGALHRLVQAVHGPLLVHTWTHTQL